MYAKKLNYSYIRKFCSNVLVDSQKVIGTKTTIWNQVPLGPPDPILGLNQAFKFDKFEKKVLLGMGTYRDDLGKPQVMPCVRQACDLIHQRSLNMEYLPIDGDPNFCAVARNLIFGENSKHVKDDTIATVQCISGTGAMNLASTFLSRHWPGSKIIHVSNPTWPCHKTIFLESELEVKEYRYLNHETLQLDFEGLMEDLNEMPNESMLLFHACAHNPTGLDPSEEQWMEIAKIVKAKNSFVLFDMMYQGLVSGDIVKDSFAPRYFAENGVNIAVAACFAKNMGLYGERIGVLCFTTGSKEAMDRVLSQLKIIIRACYSNPPINGARIVYEILSNNALFEMWMKDLNVVTNRIQQMRKHLHDLLHQKGSIKNWDHILQQTGMFAYTGLNSKQVEMLIKQYHIYLVLDGRISLAGLNPSNIEYVAEAIHQVTSK